MFNEDEDDIFSSTPKSKFFDIVYNANRNLVEFELENIIEKYVVMERLLEEQMDETQLDSKIRNYILDQADSINSAKNDFFIGFVGDVLTNNE